VAPRKKPAAASVSLEETPGELSISVGNRFRASSPRGDRHIQIEAVDPHHPPRVEAREIYPAAPCPHLTAALLGACGLCPPAREPDRDTFTIVLTWSAGAWRMPRGYQPAE
jgi:hypothetical protein